MSSKWLQASFKVALHMTLPDKQRYLRNYYMISNVEDIVVFLGLKLSNSDNSDTSSCSRNVKVPFLKKPHLNNEFLKL